MPPEATEFRGEGQEDTDSSGASSETRYQDPRGKFWMVETPGTYCFWIKKQKLRERPVQMGEGLSRLS